MNTPAHLIFAAAAFGKPEKRGTLTAALLGGFFPDLSLYLLVFWHLRVLGTPADVVFRDLYFSDSWMAIFAVDNSLILWSLALGIAFWRGWPVVMAFCAGALLHIALDFPLHAGDGRPHFWPVSDWVFDSPVSYWDNRHFAWIVGPVELAVSALFVWILWRRFPAWGWRAGFVALLLMEAAASNVWFFVF